MDFDPRKIRLSPHFVLSDFLGSHSIYSRGLANVFDPENEKALLNGQALCEMALEPILAEFGPMSVSYGFISPEVSRKTVTYMNPDEPSHHRWDKGAAADICVHPWVMGGMRGKDSNLDLYFPESAVTSPIALAHGIDYLDIPYSRILTYSESPYLCVAVSAEEVRKGAPRKAFYENKFNGVPKAKPTYSQLSTPAARARHLLQLQEQGLEHPWQGGGYPTYHGGGRCQYQHQRCSKYTMISDWLFDLQSVTQGAKNIPCLHLDSVQDAFAAAGLVYDWLIDCMGVPRASIVAGYVSHLNPYSDDDGSDWRKPVIKFTLNLPDAKMFSFGDPAGVKTYYDHNDEFLEVTVDVDTVLSEEWNA